mmetsp:Transcript_22555/g.55835  ORF Transcript_22555/g.55835 Transcript_22555/m.55835 type:complete len:457 (-) Transcript_22555:2472-3842(-)
MPGRGPGGGGANTTSSSRRCRDASSSRPTGSLEARGGAPEACAAAAAAAASSTAARGAPPASRSAAAACDSSALPAAAEPSSSVASHRGAAPAPVPPCAAAEAPSQDPWGEEVALPAAARSTAAAANSTTAWACDRAAANTPGWCRAAVHRRSHSSNALSSLVPPAPPAGTSHHPATTRAMALSSLGPGPRAQLATSYARTFSADASAANLKASASSSSPPPPPWISASTSGSATTSSAPPSPRRAITTPLPPEEVRGKQASRRDTSVGCERRVATAPRRSCPPTHTASSAPTAAASIRGSRTRISPASPRHSHNESSMLLPSPSLPLEAAAVATFESCAGSSMDSASMGWRAAAAVMKAAAARAAAGARRAAAGVSARTMAARASSDASIPPLPFPVVPPLPTATSQGRVSANTDAEGPPDAASAGSACTRGGSSGAAEHTAARAGSARGQHAAA